MGILQVCINAFLKELALHSSVIRKNSQNPKNKNNEKKRKKKLVQQRLPKIADKDNKQISNNKLSSIIMHFAANEHVSTFIYQLYYECNAVSIPFYRIANVFL